MTGSHGLRRDAPDISPNGPAGKVGSARCRRPATEKRPGAPSEAIREMGKSPRRLSVAAPTVKSPAAAAAVEPAAAKTAVVEAAAEAAVVEAAAEAEPVIRVAAVAIPITVGVGVSGWIGIAIAAPRRVIVRVAVTVAAVAAIPAIGGI